MTDEVFNLMRYFPKSYINANKELILEEKMNVYFSLDRVSPHTREFSRELGDTI